MTHTEQTAHVLWESSALESGIRDELGELDDEGSPDAEILRSILDSLPDERTLGGIRVRDEELRVSDCPAARTAATGDRVGDPIEVSAERFARMDLFEKIGLFVHELGHHHKIADHALLDRLGARVAQRLRRASSVLEHRGIRVYNVDFRDGQSLVFVDDGTRILPLLETLNHNLELYNEYAESERIYGVAELMELRESRDFRGESGLTLTLNARTHVRMIAFANHREFDSTRFRDVLLPLAEDPVTGALSIREDLVRSTRSEWATYRSYKTEYAWKKLSGNSVREPIWRVSGEIALPQLGNVRGVRVRGRYVQSGADCREIFTKSYSFKDGVLRFELEARRGSETIAIENLILYAELPDDAHTDFATEVRPDFEFTSETKGDGTLPPERSLDLRVGGRRFDSDRSQENEVWWSPARGDAELEVDLPDGFVPARANLRVEEREIAWWESADESTREFWRRTVGDPSVPTHGLELGAGQVSVAESAGHPVARLRIPRPFARAPRYPAIPIESRWGVIVREIRVLDASGREVRFETGPWGLRLVPDYSR